MSIPIVELPANPIRTIRLGRLVATPEFLDAIPRAVMSRALRTHSRAVSQTLETCHSFEGTKFRIRTEPDARETSMWLEERDGW
jgi:hypothetical protein